MTATSLSLDGSPIRFLGAFLTSVNSSLGLQQSASTCNVQLVEDPCSTPVAEFEAPEPGDFKTIIVGKFRFAGIITSFNEDIVNIGGRTIQVSLSDPREIMSSIPMILTPGYRTVAAQIANTQCSVLDIFGAFDDANDTGLNLSGWNQSGMPYASIALALKGGTTTAFNSSFNVVGQVAKAFGEKYRFILDEVTAKVDPGYRVNSNLLALNDLIQELASRHSFDWYVESERNVDDNIIDVTIRIIDRSVDNVDLGLDSFLAANSGFVVEASRGFELRNDVACSVLLGASVEQIRTLTVDAMANNPIDLSSESFADNYLMPEIEMRFVLTSKEEWKLWVSINGDLDRYTVGGAGQQLKIAPLWDTGSEVALADLAAQHGVAPPRQITNKANDKIIGKIFDKLKAAAESTYGKRFIYTMPTDAEVIDAAWTVDGVSGGVFNPLLGGRTSDPNEYFRNENGKTRCYIEFKATTTSPFQSQGVLGFGGSFVFGKGPSKSQPLTMVLAGQFLVNKFNIEPDKADWIIFNDALYMAATIEEDNVVRIDVPVLISEPDEDENKKEIRKKGPQGQQNVAQAGGVQRDKAKRNQQKRFRIRGSAQPILHPSAYQATRVFIPVKDKFLRYGPVFSTNITPTSQGKLVIDSDDGFAPWEYGGQAFMLTAMQLKVDNAASNVKKVETADVNVEGFPKLSIGDTLGFNSNVNGINISFGTQGVRTTYQLRSFLRVFGELSKQDLASLSIFARRGGARIFAQDTVSFINRYRAIISKQFAGRGGRSTSGFNGGALNFE